MRTPWTVYRLKRPGQSQDKGLAEFVKHGGRKYF